MVSKGWKSQKRALAREMRLKGSVMGLAVRDNRVPYIVLLVGLVLLASAERRLAYLDFDAPRDVRIENNDKPDGDEIFNRLVFFDTSTEPSVPTDGVGGHAAVVLGKSSARSLIVVRLSEPRAPPFQHPSHV